MIFDISEKIYIGGFGNTFRVKRKDDPLTLYALKVSAKGAEGLQVSLVDDDRKATANTSCDL